MENSINETLDLKSLLRYLLRNWYWFLISFVFFAAALWTYRSAKPQLIKSETILQIRPADEYIFMPGTGLVPTMNKSIDIADERTVLMSRDVITQAVNELDLHVSYQKKKNLQWVEQLRDSGDLLVTYPEGFLNDRTKPIVLTVSVRDDYINVKTTIENKTIRERVVSLDRPFVTETGCTLVARKPLKKGAKYRVTIATTEQVAYRYREGKMKTYYPYRSKAMVEIYVNSVRPHEAVEVLSRQTDIYNRIMLADRQETARKTIQSINEHIAELNEQKANSKNKDIIDQLILLLSQRREEKALLVDAPTMPAVTVVKAHVCKTEQSPSNATLAALILILGFCVPFGVLVLLFVTSGKIYTEAQFEKWVEVPHIGSILENAKTADSEQFNIVRMNLLRQFEKAQDKVVMVTSATQGEGKSCIAANLALSLASLNKRTLLVDLNLRRPAVNTIFNVNNKVGVTDYLTGNNADQSKLITASGANEFLDILPAGQTVANPADLLQNEKLDQLFAALRKQYDYIVMDAAQMMEISDTLVANRVCDVTLCIGRVEKTTQEMAKFINKTAEKQLVNKVVAVWNGVK